MLNVFYWNCRSIYVIVSSRENVEETKLVARSRLIPITRIFMDLQGYKDLHELHELPGFT